VRCIAAEGEQGSAQHHSISGLLRRLIRLQNKGKLSCAQAPSPAAPPPSFVAPPLWPAPPLRARRVQASLTHKQTAYIPVNLHIRQ
jgi:hypothetical protein